ncbi:transporter [Roseateles paludis]|uniref:Transporter n=1 Tax=Roseateles paludis TaxID=3145238 RepID=A0ABV0FZ24_9BURK
MKTRAARLCGAAAMAVASLVLQPAWADDEGLSTDRPDFVESSNVVGKGVFQIETSLAHERDRSGGVKTSVRSTPTLLRYGLSEALELRLESDGLLRQSVTDSSGVARARGTADASLGLKWHVRDGDEGSRKPALALLAHLDLDSGSAAFRAPGKVPSLRLVAEWELPGDASFGVMPGMAYAVNDTTGQRYWSGILAATYSRPLVGALRGFVELAGQALRSKRNGGNVVTFDAGLTYAIDLDTQLDFSVNLGTNRQTPDRALAIGFSRRFR